MQKECLKCGTVSDQEYECPNCGVIYKKYEEYLLKLEEKKKQEEKEAEEARMRAQQEEQDRIRKQREEVVALNEKSRVENAKKTGNWMNISEDNMTEAFSEVMLTTTSGVPNATIEKVLEIVSAENMFDMKLFQSVLVRETDEIRIGRNPKENRFRDARIKTLGELKIEALRCGADAVVDMSIDYKEMHLNGTDMLLIVATGTAVKISKRVPLTATPDEQV